MFSIIKISPKSLSSFKIILGGITDKLEISAEAKQLSEITSYSVERNERVQQIKEQVEAGTYKVNPENLAANLLSYYNVEKNDESR